MSVNEKMTAIADAIRGKTGGTTPLTLDQMAAEIAGIETGGGNNPLDYMSCISHAFHGVAFPNGTELAVAFGNRVATSNATDVLSYVANGTTGLASIKISSPTQFTKGFSMSYAFADASSVEIIDLSGMAQPLLISDFGRCFMDCTNLREIRGTFDMSKSPSVTNTFHSNTRNVEEIRFAQGTINVNPAINRWGKLSDASIQSIIDGLADLSGGTAQTLALHATVGAKLTDAQKASASAKNWTISY